MDKKQVVAFLGAILLFIGVFTPIVSVPLLGNLNYFRNGEGDGVIVLVLAIVSALLAFAKLYKGLWLTGAGSLAVLGFTFYNFQSKMSEIRSSMEKELSGNPFVGLGKAALDSVQLQWGWAVLVVGACLVLAAAMMREEIQLDDEPHLDERKCPFCAENIRVAATICRFCKSDLRVSDPLGVAEKSTPGVEPDIFIQPPLPRDPTID